MPAHFAIISPVYNDWEAFATLLDRICDRYRDSNISFHVVAVDDGSATAGLDFSNLSLLVNGCIVELELLRLATNLGHQRAIAVGLSHIAHRTDLEAAIVMDSDGEDRPEDIEFLIKEAHKNRGRMIVAARTKRSEGWTFCCSYVMYKLLFRLLTGQSINFGNYSLLPITAVRRLTHMPELWNNFAATIMRSRVPYVAVSTARGHRYAGRSRMKFVDLLLHGLSAISVYADRIFARILVAGAAFGLVCILGIIVATAIRFGTSLAIPGWATNVVGNLSILLMQIIAIVVASTLMMLAGRAQRPMMPIVDAGAFVSERLRWTASHPLPVAVAETA